MAQKYQIVSLLWTLISQAWNGLLRHFQCLKSSAGNSLAVEKGPRSIAPQGAELWPFKEGYRLLNFSKMGENCSSVFKHSFLRPGVEFCKNSKTQNHQNEVLLPWNRHPGQWELWKASYSRIEWVNVTVFSLILVKWPYLGPEMDFFRNSKS